MSEFLDIKDEKSTMPMKVAQGDLGHAKSARGALNDKEGGVLGKDTAPIFEDVGKTMKNDNDKKVMSASSDVCYRNAGK